MVVVVALWGFATAATHGSLCTEVGSPEVSRPRVFFRSSVRVFLVSSSVRNVGLLGVNRPWLVIGRLSLSLLKQDLLRKDRALAETVIPPKKTLLSTSLIIGEVYSWLYLAIVIDLYSRKVIGWAMDKRMKADLVNKALRHAIASRNPAEGLIWHTDRGSQYASKSHRKLIVKEGIKQSMSRKGNCWDNAPSESFFATLKKELVYLEVFKTREQAKKAIFEYIEVFYNRQRIHSANDYWAPTMFEEMLIAA